MTTHTLRNLITVTEWYLDDSGASVFYTRADKPGKSFQWHVEPIELIQGLDAIASIDEYTLAPITVTTGGATYTFDNFTKNHKLSQWEALNLAVRHEVEFEESKNMELLEIDNIFKSLQ